LRLWEVAGKASGERIPGNSLQIGKTYGGNHALFAAVKRDDETGRIDIGQVKSDESTPVFSRMNVHDQRFHCLVVGGGYNVRAPRDEMPELDYEPDKEKEKTV
jgi:hypothetical protein